jgi:hypothetical protein
MPTLRQALGNLGWPIFLKELRADFRRNRFFVTHFVCVLAIALGVLVEIYLLRDSGLTSVQLGRSLFDTFFLLQFAIALVIFPALTSTSFTEERAHKSLDLLLTTDLRPAEIVLGKFFASSAYCLITVFATVPLLALSTLFGGVRMGEVVLAYTILVGHTAVIAILGVYCSSCFASNLRSTLTVYTCVIAYVALPATSLWGPIWDKHRASTETTLIGQALEHLYPRAGELLGFAAWPGWRLIISLGLAIGFIFAFLFVLTMNRIRSSHEDRSSGLRVLAALVVGLHLLAVWAEPWPDSLKPIEIVPQVDARMRSAVWPVSAGLLFGAMLFATEPLRLSMRVRRRYLRFAGAAYPLRIFSPGAFWGLVFIGALSAASAGASWALSERAGSWVQAAGLDAEAGALAHAHLDLWRDAALTAPAYIVAFAALGFFLASADFSRGYCLLTVFFVFIITLLLPVIFEVRKLPDGLMSLYYLSPITLWNSLRRGIDKFPDEDGPRYVLFGELPIIDFACCFFLVAGAALAAAGIAIAIRKGHPLVRLGRASKPAQR